ncbi:TY-Chap domain-containing protein [Nocardia tengchongensis]|uniref:TY-Chap domain-containing protein n=1 Tax=Nocardia tengchongensis TaxID=2055889 RepID=UPI00369FCC9E
MGTQGQRERVVTTDWDTFARRLAAFLAELPSRATVILAATGNRYVQFQQFDINLSAELTGNYYLPEPISDAAAQLLRDLGWTAPALQREIENWRRTLRWPISRTGFDDLARSAARGLHEALGVGAPADLRATGWTDTHALDLSPLSARPAG